jgi:hypothetical protein
VHRTMGPAERAFCTGRSLSTSWEQVAGNWRRFASGGWELGAGVASLWELGSLTLWGPGLESLRSGDWGLGTGNWVADAMGPETGFWDRCASGDWELGTGNWGLDSGVAALWDLGTGSMTLWGPETGFWGLGNRVAQALGAGNWERGAALWSRFALGTGNWGRCALGTGVAALWGRCALGTGNWELGTGNWVAYALGARNWVLGTGKPGCTSSRELELPRNW